MVALAQSRASLSGNPGNFFLSLAVHINFGNPATDPVRYPDDRIWEFDMAHRSNFLVDVVPGTVFVASGELPPQKAMQIAVVGTLGAGRERGEKGDSQIGGGMHANSVGLSPAEIRFEAFVTGAVLWMTEYGCRTGRVPLND
uniref:Uncharacterized protein n=1 Tax=Oryza glumipatula TaxID=40148 RepID=A0A0E0AKS7_9ORYZ